MEQNFQKPTTGFDCNTLRSGTRIADKAVCVAIFVNAHARTSIDPAEVLHCARARNAAVYAFYIPSIDLAHYGRVDHLAPAGDMEAFQQYTMAQDLEQAQEAFAFLLATDDIAWQLQVLYASGEIMPTIERLRAEHTHLTLFLHRKKHSTIVQGRDIEAESPPARH